MELPEHHRRLLADALELGAAYGLALMGGYAVQAHGIVHRPSQDLDFATEHPAPMPEILDHLRRGLAARGWQGGTFLHWTAHWHRRPRLGMDDQGTHHGSRTAVCHVREVLLPLPGALLDIARPFRRRMTQGAGALAAVTALTGAALSGAGAAWAEDGGARLAASTQLAPGVDYRSFSFPASHGNVTGHLVTVDLADPHVTTDLLHPGAVGARSEVTRMADARGAVAAVNGDFFNITETQHPGVEATGAPVGPAIAGGRALKAAVPNGQRFGPALPPGTSTRDVIGVGDDRRARLATLDLKGTVVTPAGHLPLRGLNQYAIPVGGIGAFTAQWGVTSRVRSTCGTDTLRAAPCSTDVHEVVLHRGRVESVSDTPGSGPIAPDATVLVGREEGAQQLRKLSPGDPAEVLSHLEDTGNVPLTFAVGGYPIARDGHPLTGVDDVVAAGRSAAGIGDSGQRLYLLSLDGNAETSAGLTIAELAALLLDVGAEDAVNLDGGGSSTLAVRTPGATASTAVNRPPGSFERPVPNAIGVFSRR